jgi:hypothetical protein
MAFVNPLDLQYLFVTLFAGNFAIAMAIMLIALGTAAAYFRMPNIVVLALFTVFLLIMRNSLPVGMFVVGIIIFALIIMWSIARFIKN